MTDLVSVVIPCRNDLRLARALNSVAHQTYQPVEMIVVDDASQPPILPGGAKLIRFDRQVGPAAARNAGMEAASGDWVAFLDADDWWFPSKLARQMERLHDTGRAWSYTDCYYDPSPGQRRPNSFFHRFPAMPDGLAVHEAHLAGHNFITMSSPVVRRSVCPTFHNLPVSEDWDWFTRLAADYPPAAVAEPLHIYTLTPNGGRHYAALDQYIPVNLAILERLYHHWFVLPDEQAFAVARARIVERAAVQYLNANRTQEAHGWLAHAWSAPLRGTLRHWALRLAAAAGPATYQRLLRMALWAGRV